ncbi:MAG: hypothetical protein Q8P33_02265 [bacterium]|nr:hypothetical protein [bacterium]
MIEVELRARFGRQKHDELLVFLNKNAESLGNDDKDVYYFILPDRLLKLVNNTTKHAAKLSLKLNRIGRGAAFEEIECGIVPDQFGNAVNLVKALNLTRKVIHEPQQRQNFSYKGCEIALKFSKTWGHHMEIESLIDNNADTSAAEKKVHAVAKELGVTLMTEQELTRFVESIENKL